MSESIITVDRLTKYYGLVVGIQQLSFSVTKGEIFGFLGPNGAGKTTTIRLLLDLLRPSGGQAAIFGKPVSQHSLEIRRRCGYLPGSFEAYGHMTGKEFLLFATQLRGCTQSRQKQLLEGFTLSTTDLLKKVKHLSHGNKQKLGIIQAFLHQPELLILDEPTTGLDPLMQEAFYDLLREIQKKGSTIFFSSHNLPEVEKVCDRVAIIRNGNLVALESLDNLRRKRFRKLFLTLRHPLDSLELAGADLLEQDGARYVFLVKGDFQKLMRQLANLPLLDIVFPEPELEDVFMTYYRSGQSA